MAKKAKRLVSESLHSLSTVAGSFTLSSFGRALAHFPQSPDHRPSVSAIVSSYARHTRRALDTICGRECQAVISRRSIS
jgi:hypothetical protein